MAPRTPGIGSARRHRWARALALFGALVVACSVAMAASLGGLSAQQLGANTTVVAPCDTNGVTLAYTTGYNPTAGRYDVTSATVSGIAAACIGQTLALTLADSSFAALGSGTATVTGANQTVTFTPSVDAEAVVRAAVVITG